LADVKKLRTLTLVGVILAFVVVTLGAFTRLVDAGLGCPDWPGCYGHLTVPDEAHEIATAERMYDDDAPFEAGKAWAEMVHRYFAGTLGLVVLGILIVTLRTPAAAGQRALAVGLAVLVVAQAAFGMWTVTLKLWPQVVTAHLLGGFATFALLWWLWLRLGPAQPAARSGRLRGHVVLALAVLIAQIALGGWVSSNYAALACPDFPTCQTEWWPPVDFAQGFNVFQHVGPNYLGGLLDSSARAAIQLTHRLGALVTLLVLGALAWRLWTVPEHRAPGAVLAAVLALQVCLGIGNVIFSLPLWIATAHNGVGALLLIVMVAVAQRLSSGTQSA
jgi:cytochrome c oxidase assembly protein subunit 15